MTTSHNASSVRRHRESGGGTTKQQQHQLKSKSSSKDKTRGDANKKHHQSKPKSSSKDDADTRSDGDKPPIHKYDSITSNNRKATYRRRTIQHIPHEYTPFHHLSLDVMDGVPDANEQEFGADPELEPHDYIGDESTTILTPSYDSTTTSTIAAYLDEVDDQTTTTMGSYSHTTHDLQYIGHWTETQGTRNQEVDMLPSYMNAMSIGRRYSPRVNVRRAMIGIELAFSRVEQSYETTH